MLKEVGKTAAELSREVLSPPATELGRVLGDAITVSFGWLEKMKVKQEHNIKLFKEGLQNGLDNIKPENIVQPQLHIMGPAIDACKYYIESEELRQLFINLIVSSSDSSKQSKVHPSFVEIIKQLSPEDARCFRYLCDEIKTAGCCALHLYDNKNTRSYKEFKYIFDFPGMDAYNFVHYMSIADNLIRLGLIDCSVDTSSIKKERYNKLRTIDFSSTINIGEKEPIAVEMKEAFWSLTTLGQSFRAAVI